MFGRASKLNAAGKVDESMSVAREALDLLRAPYVVRHRGPEGAILCNLTVLVEDAARSRGVPGADARDIRDTVQFLKLLPSGSLDELQSWVPYLEWRLNDQRAA